MCVPYFCFTELCFHLLLISVHNQTGVSVHVRPVIKSSAYVGLVHDNNNNNIFTIIYNNIMLPFYYFVTSTFTFLDYNNIYFLNMDIYILILIIYMFSKYKYSHFYITSSFCSILFAPCLYRFGTCFLSIYNETSSPP